MKLISWNVNGLRACVKKGFLDFFQAQDADIFCIQETKLQPGQIELELPGYRQYFFSAEKKGYSGTAIFTKDEPLSCRYGIGLAPHDSEGRTITLEYPDFYMVDVYTPNAQHELTRLDYRMEWEDAFRAYLMELDACKPVVVCGDMNVAHREIDLKNPKTNVGNAGFTYEEREKIGVLLDSGFADTFRRLYPDRTDAYTWWSYRAAARQRNIGWRIDYFLVSERLMPSVRDSVIFPEIEGSDHCPIGLMLQAAAGSDRQKA
jgi:exodeoxyribonuclease-3